MKKLVVGTTMSCGCEWHTKNKKLHFIDGPPLSFYRVHNNNLTNTRSKFSQDKLKLYLDKKYNLSTSRGIVNTNISNQFKIEAIDLAKIKINWSDSPSGFSKEHSQNSRIMLPFEKQEFSFHINSKTSGIDFIRFNIGDKVGLLNIHNLTIEDSNGNVLWNWGFEILNKNNCLLIHHPAFFQERTIQLSTSPDASFTVYLNKPYANATINKLTIKITLSRISSDDIVLLQTINTPLTYHSQNEITEAKSVIENVQQEKSNLLQQLDLLNTRVVEMQNESNLLLSRIEGITNEKSHLNNLIESKQAHIEELKAEHRHTVEELKNEQSSAITELKTEQNRAIEELKAMQNQAIEILKAEQNRFMVDAEEKNKTISLLFEKNNTLIKNTTLFVRQLEDLTLQEANFTTIIEQQQDHIKNINIEMQSIVHQNINISDKYNTLVKDGYLRAEHLLNTIKNLEERIAYFEGKYHNKNVIQLVVNRIAGK